MEPPLDQGDSMENMYISLPATCFTYASPSSEESPAPCTTPVAMVTVRSSSH
jgi:hypothetical protein